MRNVIGLDRLTCPKVCSYRSCWAEEAGGFGKVWCVTYPTLTGSCEVTNKYYDLLLEFSVLHNRLRLVTGWWFQLNILVSGTNQ